MSAYDDIVSGKTAADLRSGAQTAYTSGTGTASHGNWTWQPGSGGAGGLWAWQRGQDGADPGPDEPRPTYVPDLTGNQPATAPDGTSPLPPQPTIPTSAPPMPGAAPVAPARQVYSPGTLNTAGYTPPPSAQGSLPRSPIVVQSPDSAQLQYLQSIGVGGQPAAPATSTPPGAAPVADRSKIDPLEQNVNSAISGLYGLAAQDQQSSVAEAQLRQAQAQATSTALGQARSGNRRDRAGAERQALEEGQYNLQAQGRDLATLRATEEQQKIQTRLAAYKAAGDLGLNQSALEINLDNINTAAATSYINNQFQQANVKLNINEQEAQRVTQFAQAMALLGEQYYGLSQAEQDQIRDDYTRRYGIDQSTSVALKQLAAGRKVNWTQFLLGLGQGAITGAATIGGALLGGPAGAAAGAVAGNAAGSAINVASQDNSTGAYD